MNCRHCSTELKRVFVDLVTAPISTAMITNENIFEPEKYFPLKIFVCSNCKLVQVDEMQKAEEIFNERYSYFSSYSTSWLAHAKSYVDMMMERFKFNSDSLVMEIASNDGYLLQYFKEYNIPVLGIEPSSNTADVAMQKGIESITEFFNADFASRNLVEKNRRPNLIIGNNVLAHVPDINDFVKGIKLALATDGIVTMEFPHIVRLISENQFDTIYHEHFSYFSFTVVKKIFNSQKLELFDVDQLDTHGGSLRIYAKHSDNQSISITDNVNKLLQEEDDLGVNNLDYYQGFQSVVDHIKYEVWEFLINQKKKGKRIIGYGAAAKGNTLLNYCGIKGTDLVECVIDASPHRQGRFLPGSRIPVFSKVEIEARKPDFVIIFPWNLKNEITGELDFIRNWGGQFVIFIPQTMIF